MLIAIGDVHGCATEFKSLLKLVKSYVGDTPNNTLVMLGDYIDRGPDSKEVLDILINWNEPNIDLVPLLGNHDQMMIDVVYSRDEPDLWISNGGAQTIKSISDNELKHYSDWMIFNLNHIHTEGEFVFAHAGINADVPLNEQTEHDVLWSRQINKYPVDQAFPNNCVVVHGHTPVSNLEQIGNRINVDTACVFGNKLTAVFLADRKIVHSVSIKKGK